jgi:hypothetical protein
MWGKRPCPIPIGLRRLVEKIVRYENNCIICKKTLDKVKSINYIDSMKKKNKRATVNINVQISPALKGDILAAAKADDRNLSSWIRKVLSDAIIKNVKF